MRGLFRHREYRPVIYHNFYIFLFFFAPVIHHTKHFFDVFQQVFAYICVYNRDCQALPVCFIKQKFQCLFFWKQQMAELISDVKPVRNTLLYLPGKCKKRLLPVMFHKILNIFFKVHPVQFRAIKLQCKFLRFTQNLCKFCFRGILKPYIFLFCQIFRENFIFFCRISGQCFSKRSIVFFCFQMNISGITSEQSLYFFSKILLLCKYGISKIKLFFFWLFYMKFLQNDFSIIRYFPIVKTDSEAFCIFYIFLILCHPKSEAIFREFYDADLILVCKACKQTKWNHRYSIYHFHFPAPPFRHTQIIFHYSKTDRNCHKDFPVC